MSRLPKSLHSPWLPVAKIYETDRFPRRMDCKTAHADRNLIHSGLKMVRLNREEVDVDLSSGIEDNEDIRSGSDLIG